MRRRRVRVPRRRLRRDAVELRAQRAEEALRRERERRQQESRRSLLSAMVTDLASGFVNAPSDAVDRAIIQALQELCHAVGADRVQLGGWDASTARLTWGQGWARSGAPGTAARGPWLDLAGIPAWRSCAAEGRILDTASAAALATDDPLRALMSGWGTGSLLALPLMEEERCTGFLVVETCGRELRWSHDEFSALVVAAELFASSSMRRQHEAALERALDETRSALRAKDAFLANLSHELHTPLHGVIGMAQLLAGIHMPETQLQQVRTIQQSAAHLQRLLDDLIDYASIESGGSSAEAVVVDLRALLESALARCAGAHDARRVGLHLEVAGQVPGHIATDPSRLRRILDNLLDNALAHTADGSVRLSASAEGGRLLIEVADTGRGIDEALLRRLFRPFEQADTSSTRAHGGLGLGLALSQRIAGLMRGMIRVRSDPGRGSTFTVDLPLVPASAPTPPPAASPATVAGLRVLVVDDNAVNRLIAQGMLQRLGCRVTTAEDGIEGVQQALTAAYDVIFMDVQMPRMDGIAATRAIRGHESRTGKRHTPIAGLSCLRQPEDRARGQAAGMDAYLGKPITAPALAQALLELCGRREHGSAAAEGRGLALVFAEPDDPDLEILERTLAAAGVTCVAAGHAESGLLRLAGRADATATPTLAVILGSAPGATAQSIRAMPGQERLPLLMTGEPPPGMDACTRLRSPLDASEIRRLALAASTPAAPTPQPPAPAPTSCPGGIILVVDDNAVNLRLISLMAAQSGHPVACCADGQAAVDRVAQGGIGLVLMDCQMPVMDGYDATREIRRREAEGGRRLPIVAVTAHVLPENRDRCTLAGMDGFLTKPLNGQTLLETIARWLPGGRTAPAPASAAPRAAPEDPHIDLAPMRHLDASSPGAGEEIATTMLQDLQHARQDFPGLATAATLGQLGKEAHKLKGAAGSIGGIGLSRVCARLEHAARIGDLEASRSALTALLQAIPAFEGALRAYLAED